MLEFDFKHDDKSCTELPAGPNLEKPATEEERPEIQPFETRAYILAFLDRHFFLEMIILSIIVAYIYPPIGKTGGYIRSEITSKWVAICLIFLWSGIKLKTQELLNVLQDWRQNLFIQFNIFITFSVLTFSIYKILSGSVSRPLLQGLVILGCLPSTINMSFVLCSTAQGNDVISVINAALCNLLGIFLTPALVLLYLSDSSSIDFVGVIFKLALKVVAPILVGQAIRASFFEQTNAFVKRHKKVMKKITTLLLVLVVYASFCNMFHEGVDAKASDFAITFCLCLFVHITMVTYAFFASGLLGWERKDRIADIYCITEKTAAMGIPLIEAMFEADADLGLYQVPLLIYHPMQLFMASFAMSWTIDWVMEIHLESQIDRRLSKLPSNTIAERLSIARDSLILLES